MVAGAARRRALGGIFQVLALYDGHCRFCTQQVRQLERLVGASRLAPVSFQDEGALTRFPGVSYEACMERMHLVRPDGRVFAGAEAVARTLARVPVLGLLAFVYYVPGASGSSAGWGYRIIAKYRYRDRWPCRLVRIEGSCSLHR